MSKKLRKEHEVIEEVLGAFEHMKDLDGIIMRDRAETLLWLVHLIETYGLSVISAEKLRTWAEQIRNGSADETGEAP